MTHILSKFIGGAPQVPVPEVSYYTWEGNGWWLRVIGIIVCPVSVIFMR